MGYQLTCDNCGDIIPEIRFKILDRDQIHYTEVCSARCATAVVVRSELVDRAIDTQVHDGMPDDEMDATIASIRTCVSQIPAQIPDLKEAWAQLTNYLPNGYVVDPS